MSARKARRTTRAKDPIFALINTHAAAREAYDKVAVALDKLESELPNGLTGEPKCFQHKDLYQFQRPADVERHVKEHIGRAGQCFGPRVGARIRRLARTTERELKAMLQEKCSATIAPQRKLAS